MRADAARIPVCSSIVLLMLVLSAPAAEGVDAIQAASMTIVEDGKPMAAIVVSPDANEVVKPAVADLQAYIEKISGAKLLIADSPDVPGNLILVGRMPAVDRLIADLDEYDLGHDGIVIRLFPGTLVITGQSDRNSVSSRSAAGECRLAR